MHNNYAMAFIVSIMLEATHFQALFLQQSPETSTIYAWMPNKICCALSVSKRCLKAVVKRSQMHKSIGSLNFCGENALRFHYYINSNYIAISGVGRCISMGVHWIESCAKFLTTPLLIEKYPHLGINNAANKSFLGRISEEMNSKSSRACFIMR